MAKRNTDLDTPFKRGESVMLVRPIPGFNEGQRGKVKLISGFDDWKRYWVRFADGRLVGSVDHADLVRPRMYPQWREREAARRARMAATDDTETTAAVETTTDFAGDGIAAQIPAHLLERSRAAKARLTGG